VGTTAKLATAESREKRIHRRVHRGHREGKMRGLGFLRGLCELCGEFWLEVAAEFAEGWEDDEFADAGEDGFVFELPGVLVRNVNGV
jgi:hypothetical protein